MWLLIDKLYAFLQITAVKLDAKMHTTIFNDFVDTSDFSAAEGEMLRSIDTVTGFQDEWVYSEHER